MSVSFNSNSAYLSTWGFSLGDIAVISGAGRAIITWMTAAHRDSGLLDFLNTVPSELGLRKGLVDPEALNRRWGRELALLHNGRRVNYSTVEQKSRIDNLDRYTWLMTIMVVCLDQAVSNESLKQIITDVTIDIFADKVLELDYLRHEIPQHIEGWRSIGCVRKMTTRASLYWDQLRRDGHHLPGFVPTEDCDEIVRFLTWLTVGSSMEHVTASSDTFSLAMLLQEMGVALLRTSVASRTDENLNQFDESYVVAKLDMSIVPSSRTRPLKNRSGMRIPLLALEETVSLWPGTVESNNRRREVFLLGRRAASGIDFATRAVTSEDYNPESNRYLLAFCSDKRQLRRAAPSVFSLVRSCLLLPTQASLDAVAELMDLWKRYPDLDIKDILSDWAFNEARIPAEVLDPTVRTTRGQDAPGMSRRVVDSWEMVGDFLIFLLGYYYTALAPIVDISQMAVKEAFGAWSWYDRATIAVLREFVKTGKEYNDSLYGHGTEYSREEVLAVIAMLYAGAEQDQTVLVKRDTAGLIAKLTIVTPGLLGNADNPKQIRQFVLLDIDSTCFPSNGAKIINVDNRMPAEHMATPTSRTHMPHSAVELAIDGSPDFTAHIEPAWDYDPTLCHVVFRHEGRLVHKANPLFCEAQVLKNWAACSQFQYCTGATSFSYRHKCNNYCSTYESSKAMLCVPTVEGTSTIKVQHHVDTSLSPQFPFTSLGPAWQDVQCYRAELREFYGSHIIQCLEAPTLDLEAQRPFDDAIEAVRHGQTGVHDHVIVFVPSNGKKRARACIASMYTRVWHGSEHNEEVRSFNWGKYSETPIVIQNNSKGILVLM